MNLSADLNLWSAVDATVLGMSCGPTAKMCALPRSTSSGVTCSAVCASVGGYGESFRLLLHFVLPPGRFLVGCDAARTVLRLRPRAGAVAEPLQRRTACEAFMAVTFLPVLVGSFLPVVGGSHQSARREGREPVTRGYEHTGTRDAISGLRLFRRIS